MAKKIKASELEAEAKRLIDAREMPSLEALLQVIAETRDKYETESWRLESMKTPEADGVRHNALAQTRIVVRGVGYGRESIILNDTALPEDLKYFERPGITVVKVKI